MERETQVMLSCGDIHQSWVRVIKRVVVIGSDKGNRLVEAKPGGLMGAVGG